MIYHGLCEKQNKDYSVEYTTINSTAHEDFKGRFINGRLNCVYAGLTGCCERPSQCSVLKAAEK